MSSQQVIGRYQVIAELGRGAMGVVYKALDPTIGRTVALKTMRMDVQGLENEELLKRFKNEARAAGLLNHPNIVTIYDAGEYQGLFYIAMEYVEGVTLSHLIAEQRVLPVERMIEITRQVVAGLDFAHSQGVIHRDVKPANVIVTQGGTVKIMDFGIAKMGGGMTSTGQVLGTPNYMSPEQVKGKAIDGRSDLFSLGVMIYEMLTGEKPFAAQNVTTIIYKIVNETPIPPRELDVTIHPGLSAAVTRALSKAPEERYQSGAELARDLENYKSFGGGDPTRAVPLAVSHNHAADGEPTAIMPASGTAQPAAAPALAKVADTPAEWKKPGTRAVPNVTMAVAARKPAFLLASGLAVLAAIMVAGGFLRAKKIESVAATSPIASEELPSTELPDSPPTTSAAEQEVEKNPVAAAAPSQTQAQPFQQNAVSKIVTGDLRVITEPAGAQVQINGQSSSEWKTPYLAREIKGPVSLAIMKAGYKTEMREVALEPGATTTASVKMEPLDVALTVRTDPAGARAQANGRDLGSVTPVSAKLPPGRYTLMLNAEGFFASVKNVVLEPGKPLMIDEKLEPVPAATGRNPFARIKGLFGGQKVPDGKGMAVIETDPDGAEVLVNGAPLRRKTPMRHIAEPGTYTLTVRMRGYKPLHKTITVDEGKVTQVRERLQVQ